MAVDEADDQLYDGVKPVPLRDHGPIRIGERDSVTDSAVSNLQSIRPGWTDGSDGVGDGSFERGRIIHESDVGDHPENRIHLEIRKADASCQWLRAELLRHRPHIFPRRAIEPFRSAVFDFVLNGEIRWQGRLLRVGVTASNAAQNEREDGDG